MQCPARAARPAHLAARHARAQQRVAAGAGGRGRQRCRARRDRRQLAAVRQRHAAGGTWRAARHWSRRACRAGRDEQARLANRPTESVTRRTACQLCTSYTGRPQASTPVSNVSKAQPFSEVPRAMYGAGRQGHPIAPGVCQPLSGPAGRLHRAPSVAAASLARIIISVTSCCARERPPAPAPPAPPLIVTTGAGPAAPATRTTASPESNTLAPRASRQRRRASAAWRAAQTLHGQTETQPTQRSAAARDRLKLRPRGAGRQGGAGRRAGPPSPAPGRACARSKRAPLRGSSACCRRASDSRPARRPARGRQPCHAQSEPCGAAPARARGPRLHAHRVGVGLRLGRAAPA